MAKKCKVRGFAAGDKIETNTPTIADAVRLMSPAPAAAPVAAFDPMKDMRNLGKVNAVDSGLGAGANYGWSTLAATELPGGGQGTPAYKIGAVPAVARPAAMPVEPRAPMPALTPVDQLFPTRRFADGGTVTPPPAPTPLESLKAWLVDYVNKPPATPTPADAHDAARDRREQMDAAMKYRRGGKIKGKGTATSDSVPAVVQQTGEPIQVSNGERVLSVAQDGMMERVAKHLGFDDLDAMLEHGTGKPVGATMKNGTPAAAGGVQIPQTEWVNGVPPIRPFDNPAINPSGLDLLAQRGGTTIDFTTPTTPAALAVRAALTGEPMGPPASAAQPVRAPVVIPAGAVGTWGGEGHQPTGPIGPAPDFVASTVQPNSARITGAVSGTASKDATQMVAPNGGGFVTAPGGGRAIMIPGGGTPYVDPAGKTYAHWTDTPMYAESIARNKADAATALNMERARYGRDMQSDITNPVVVALAGANLNRMNANATAEQQAATSGQQATTAELTQAGTRLANQGAAYTVAQQKRVDDLLGSYQTETDPVRKEQILNAYQLITGSGKNFAATAPLKTSENGGMTVTERPGPFIDLRTGKAVSSEVPSQVPAVPPAAAQVKADVAAGTITRSEGLKRLKALGYS